MRRLALVLLALLLAAQAHAELQTWTCDENPAAEGVTSYSLYFDGQKVATTPKPPWPAVDMTPGAHSVSATAANTRGEGPASAPVMVPALPGATKNLHK